MGEACTNEKHLHGKGEQRKTKIPVVKFSVAKASSASSIPLSRQSDDGDDSSRFAVSFEEFPERTDDLDQEEKHDKRSQTPEPPKLSRPQQLLSAWKKNSRQNKTLSRILGESSHPSLSHKQEASDGDSDSIASYSLENEGQTTKGSKKKRQKTASPARRPESVGTGASDRDSIGSNDSSLRAEKASRLSVIIDKAKNKGRKLVYSHKNKKYGDVDSLEEISQIIAVGEDALSLEAEIDSANKDITAAIPSHANEDSSNQLSSSFFNWFNSREAAEEGVNNVVVIQQPTIFHSLINRLRNLPFLRYRVLFFIILLAISIPSPGFICGFLWGLYVSFVGFLYFFVSGPVSKDALMPNDIVLTISKELEEKKSSKNEIYKGWMNELRGIYDPSKYHVNNAHTVLVRLDGNLLRVSRLERTVLKHAFHTDPTLTELEPTISGQSIYDLTGAVVSLRPKHLARRRWWSRKYPIHIRLASKNSEISTSSSLRRSYSVNQAFKLVRSASSDDESSDNDKEQHLGERRRIRSSERMKTLFMESLEYNSPESSEEESENILDAKNGRANSVDNVSFGSEPIVIDRCRNNRRNGRGRSLYFFVRSAREKERWFHRLREACSQYGRKTEEKMLPKSGLNEFSSLLSGRRLSLPSIFAGNKSSKSNLEYFLYVSNHVQFQKCINELFKTSHKKDEKQTDGGVVYMDLGRNKWIPGNADTDSQLVMSANAIAARIFYDFCRDSYWCKQVQDKIQSKLATVHLPYFIETLELSNLNLGTTPPEIVGVYAPILDDWGLWIDFELKYRGGIHLTLETKVNLMKLKEGLNRGDMFKEVNKTRVPMRVHHYSDSDLPESPESSPDEDFGSKTEKISANKESTGKKLLNVVDKIASSNIFQGASEFKPVKKMMEGISSTRLLLNVDVTCLDGTMTINIPPPPSDRLWYAFRTPPKLSIRCVPQVGDRSVDMSTVSSWIESKLCLLLEKNLVCPNMDDLIVPVMSGNELLKSGYNR